MVVAEPHVVVAALTYRRPDDLRDALPHLVEQLDRATGFTATLLIVDNDPDASAREAVLGFGDARVRYVHEPRPGIATARNRALDEAGRADALVFIDDDERPVEGWLAAMVEVWRAETPTAVVGPVISEFAGQPDEFVAAGRFFDRRRLATGTRVDVAATNNLLLDLDLLRSSAVRFDEDFGLSGGSDTLFTRQLDRLGHRMVWCDEAVVVDVVPPGRLTRDWVLRRAFRSGNSWARSSLRLAPTPRARLTTRVRLLGPGLVRAGGGAAVYALGLLTGSLARRARGARTFARGAGMATGAGGYVYREYAREGTSQRFRRSVRR